MLYEGFMRQRRHCGVVLPGGFVVARSAWAMRMSSGIGAGMGMDLGLLNIRPLRTQKIFGVYDRLPS
ncbi:MAG: hypothetical protein ACJAVR_000877 [Paracoccaceae bacterium]|jgi:hypothetical protein